MKSPLARLTLPLVATLLALTLPAHGQEQKRGDASLRVEFQFVKSGNFHTDNLEFSYWSTDTQVLAISGDYAINDRWTVFATLPYVRKRFNPEADPNNPFHPPDGDPHDPTAPYWTDFVPSDRRFRDDGDYHGGLQDFSIGVSYSFHTDRWGLYPYISYGVPATDYPFYAKAAIGKNLWTLPVGLSFTFTPFFSDWHFDGNVAYVFSEKPLGYDVDYWLAHVSAGYWFRPNLSVNAFLTYKDGNGVSIFAPEFVREGGDPFNYPNDWNTEEWYNHDRLIANENANFGLGVDYFFSPEWKITGTGFRSFSTNETTAIDYAFTLSVTRFFDGD
ncbi:MAG: hypothetical protein QNI96_04570 [Woeseiaceae bacterium]|nr:hypothetical protein [Woeseiaceae bacterium]